MKKLVFIITIIIIAISGCKKHTVIEQSDFSMKLGNIYCSDGSIVDPKTYQRNGLNNGVGVIFWINPNDSIEDKAFVVSLEDLPSCQWMDENELQSTAVTTLTNSFDGASNTDILQFFMQENEVILKATLEATGYECQAIKSWYLPSVGQLLEINRNKEIVYESFKACGGQPFDNVWYWSSNEDNAGMQSKLYNAFTVSLTEGRIMALRKSYFAGVRPVKSIK